MPWFKKKQPTSWRNAKKKKEEERVVREEAARNMRAFVAKSKLREATKAYKSSLATKNYKKRKYE